MITTKEELLELVKSTKKIPKFKRFIETFNSSYIIEIGKYSFRKIISELALNSNNDLLRFHIFSVSKTKEINDNVLFRIETYNYDSFGNPYDWEYENIIRVEPKEKIITIYEKV